MAQLERLNADDMVNPIKLEREIARANALTQVGNTLINSAKAEANFLKQIGGKEHQFYTPMSDAPQLDAPAPRVEKMLEFTEVEEVKPDKPVSQVKQRAERMDKELLEDAPKPKGDDLAGKVPLKIDEKTTIFVRPDADVEAIKARYAKK